MNDPIFPTLCAHRGLSQACPENTLPAFGAALAMGVQEIEFDVRMTRDDVLVICHDARVDRTTNGQGAIRDLLWDDLRQLDTGAHYGPQWRGLSIPRFADVLRLNAGRAVINIHIKDDGDMTAPIRKICDLVRAHQQADRVYLALESPASLRAAREYAPEIARCCLNRSDTADLQIDAALEFGCARLQFYRNVTDAHIQRARASGLVCNLFWSDEIKEARYYAERGIDVILTNCAHQLLADGFFTS